MRLLGRQIARQAWRVVHGDCREVLARLPAESIDASVSDPPYGLNFMARDWDCAVPGTDHWVPVHRALRPGAANVAFGGTRTHHQLFWAIERSAFELRDALFWLYGSGFPKSHNLDEPFEGWGTALKPAVEPICLSRKPLKGTVRANMIEHGVGALNIDACRIPRAAGDRFEYGVDGDEAPGQSVALGAIARQAYEVHEGGRWPANIILDEDAARLLDEDSGTSVSRRGKPRSSQASGDGWGMRHTGAEYDDAGGASRFFLRFKYCAKASRAEREAGLEELDPEIVDDGRQMKISNPYLRGRTLRRNIVPTVKPIDLMRWLIRLTTQPGALVLDPFCGSGSTGIAALLEGRRFIGIEADPRHAVIARARLRFWARFGRVEPHVTTADLLRQAA